MCKTEIYHPTTFKECFYFDENSLNNVPKGILRKISALILNPRYSSWVYFRLSQYFLYKSKNNKRILKVVLLIFSNYFTRKNIKNNCITISASQKVKRGIIFHHTNVIMTTNTILEENVHIYGNVTFGIKNGEAPYIKREAKIGGNSMILGGITVGEKAIVAPMSLVLHDVPDGKIVAGIPAKVIGDVTEENYKF